MTQSSPEFTRNVLRAAVIGVLVIATAMLVIRAFGVFMLLFGAVLIALFLRGISAWLAAHSRLSPTWSFVVVLLLLALFIGGGAAFLGPRIGEQVDELGERLPDAVQRLQGAVEQYAWGRRLLAEAPKLKEAVPSAGNVLTGITGAFSTTVGWIGSFVLMTFAGIFLAAQPDLYTNGFVQLFPLAKRARAKEVLQRVGESLKLWLIGRVLVMAVVGVLIALGLLFLGIPLAMTLALIAAILDFVPNIGPIVAAVPAVLLGLMEGPAVALYVVMLYVVVQSLESYLLTPLVQQRVTELPPALVLVFQVLLGYLVGIVGLIVATPLLIVAMVVTKEVYVHDMLGDDQGR